MMSMSDFIRHHDKWFIQKHQNLSTTLRIMSVNEGNELMSVIFVKQYMWKYLYKLTHIIDLISTYVYMTLSLNSIKYTYTRRKTLVWSISVKIFGWMIKFEVRTRVVSLRKCHKTVLYLGIMAYKSYLCGWEALHYFNLRCIL